MTACRDLIARSLILVVLATAVIGAEARTSAPKQNKERQIFYEFPKDAIKCTQGDYITRESGNGFWKVFLVEDIFFLSRLIPITTRDSVVVAEQISFMDSATPPKWKEIHLLLSEFEKEYRSSRQAVESIKSGRLGNAIRGLCRSISEFPTVKSKIYRKPS